MLLHALPMFHVHGLFVACHCALLSARRMLWLPRFDAAEVVALLPHATVMMGVPTYYTRLLAEPGFGADDLPHDAPVHLRFGAAAAGNVRANSRRAPDTRSSSATA